MQCIHRVKRYKIFSTIFSKQLLLKFLIFAVLLKKRTKMQKNLLRTVLKLTIYDGRFVNAICGHVPGIKTVFGKTIIIFRRKLIRVLFCFYPMMKNSLL